MTEADNNADDIAMLLPFYANGTLDHADKARVKTALKNDASLREELADGEIRIGDGRRWRRTMGGGAQAR